VGSDGDECGADVGAGAFDLCHASFSRSITHQRRGSSVSGGPFHRKFISLFLINF
jgi:hypothetical protein